MSSFVFSKSISVCDKVISDTTLPFLIAELGLNHNNDLILSKEMILAAKESGADAVKLQSYFTEEFINTTAPKVNFLVDIFKKYELTQENTSQLHEYALSHGIILFSTPLTVSWVHLLNSMQVPLFKVASGDLDNYPLLDTITSYNKPIILSCGASLWNQVEATVSRLYLKNCKDLVVMHCVSRYPTPEDATNLARMVFIKNNFNSIVGFSDHTAGTDNAAYAVLLGASVIEKHFTLDVNLPGPDHSLSATPSQLKEIRKKINNTFYIRNSILDLESSKDSSEIEFLGDYFGKRSLYEVGGQLLSMRPRQEGLPLPKDYTLL